MFPKTRRRILPLAIALALPAVGICRGEDQTPLPPALVVPSGDRLVPLSIASIKVEARIVGYVAETRMTIVFANPNPRPLAGDLYFPLPEGATVCGYALDVNGVMVDGAVVSKDRGRQVFEKEVRKGIDPGLVEWAKGNSFKTRVFPIPASGTRTVMVSYVADLVEDKESATYHLPLNFKEKVPEFSLRVEVVTPEGEPMVSPGAVANFALAKWEQGYRGQVVMQDAVLDKDFMIALPKTAKPNVAVETAENGETYFVVSDFPEEPPVCERAPTRAPGRVAIFWDASASRGQKDHSRELGIIRGFFQQPHIAAATVAVELVIFRHAADQPRAFVIRNGDAGELLAAIQAVAYDGATQLGCLATAAKPDMILLFTDGLSNFGKEEPDSLAAPAYVVCADQTANHAFLRYLALKTGGAYFNLHTSKDEAIIASIGREVFSFLGADVDAGGAEECYPAIPRPALGRCALAGILKAEETTITLRYGRSGKVEVAIPVRISRGQTVPGELLRRYWAQKKVDDLMTFPKRNEETIADIGKRHGIVTPGTSLIVLETVEQYVEHEITPPKTMPKLLEQYGVLMEKKRQAAAAEQTSKIERVLAMWQERVKWWETEFKVPPGFKYKGGEERDDVRGAAPVASSGKGADEEGGEDELHEATDEEEEEQPRALGGRMAMRELRSPSVMMAERKAEKDDGEDEAAAEPAIALQPWNPQTPYLAALKVAKPEEAFAVYLAQRAQFGNAPAFFLDCADWFFSQNQRALGIQVLSNIAEMELENAALVRILAYRLKQIGELDLAIMLFEEAKKLRPEEPQSWRDLALCLAERAECLARTDAAKAQSDFQRALELLSHVVMNKWDRFEEIEIIALEEINRLIPLARVAGVEKHPLDPRLVKLLDVDIRIVLSWDADLTDIDLHVLEPTGERAFYSHNRTTIGGLVSRDFTQGYGPEEYMVRKAHRGTYRIETNFFGSQAQHLQGAVTLHLDIYTNYGRPNEKRQSLTVRLTESKETLTIGCIEF